MERLANLTTFAHFSTSAFITLPKSATEPPIGTPPRLASRSISFGSASAVFIALLSLSTTSAGVRRAHAEPGGGFVTGHGLRDRRHAGQGRRRLVGGHRQRAHAAAADVFDRR